MKMLIKKSSAVIGNTAANQQTSMTLNSGTAETRTYDDWGRMTARAQGSYSAAYSYRYGDRLRQVTSSFPGETATSPVYEYGGDGKMRRRGTEEIKYGLGFNPVAERTNTLMTKYFVYEPGKAVSERLAYFGGGFDTSQHYYNHDHLGSVRRTRSSTKGSVAVWDYEPYGKVHSGTASPLIFALHPYESGMRMHRAPYRNYSPSMARWTTVDPLGMVDGPNVYGYVKGNPIYYFDKNGLERDPCTDKCDSCQNCCISMHQKAVQKIEAPWGKAKLKQVLNCCLLACDMGSGNHSGPAGRGAWEVCAITGGDITQKKEINNDIEFKYYHADWTIAGCQRYNTIRGQ